MHLKLSSGNWQPLRLALNVLNRYVYLGAAADGARPDAVIAIDLDNSMAQQWP